MERLFTLREIRNFEAAKKMAETSDFGRARVGCVIVGKKSIISSGYNSHKTHPLQKLYNQERKIDDEHAIHSMHAETSAVSKLYGRKDIDWGNLEVYIYRICGDREFGMARPCKSCMKLLKECGIKHIFYTTDHGLAYERLRSDAFESC